MLKFLKIIVWIFSFGLLLLLISVSFFWWDKKIDKDLDFLFYDNEVKNLMLSTKIYKINNLDQIFYLKNDSFSVEKKLEKTYINLKKGSFVLNLNDLTKNYFIKMDWFKLELPSAWSIYINTSSNRTTIFSLNWSFYLHFLDKNNNLINKYFMYPHQWIKANPKLNIIYKNADLYRIKTSTQNGFFAKSMYLLFDVNNLKEEEKNKFIQLFWEESIDLVISYLKFKKETYSKNRIILRKINSIEKNSFPLWSFLDEYYKFFINDTKRSYFLQSNIFNKIIYLVNYNYNEKILNKITNDLNILKYLNIFKYKQLNSIIDRIYNNFIIMNNEKLVNFILLKEPNFDFNRIKFSIPLKEYFTKYNFWQSYKNIKEFDSFTNIFLSNTLDVNTNKIESFMFYLSEYINWSLFQVDVFYKWDFSINTNYLSNQINILRNYINLNKKIYFWEESNNIKKLTSLQKNKKILDNISIFLRKNFFLEHRNVNSNILLLNNINYDLKDIKALKKEVNRMISLSYINKEIVDNNIILKNDYINLEEKFKELFLALTNYEQYKVKYDLLLKKLHTSRWIWAKTLKEYWVDYVYNYLSQFNWFNFSRYTIVKKEDFFVISNVFILGKQYKVNFYPNLWNRIDFLNQENIVFLSYDLDRIEPLLADKYKWAESEFKYRYDFKNFFLERLSSNETKNYVNIKKLCNLRWKLPNPNYSKYKWNEMCISRVFDSPVISEFKRNTLLREEFSILSNFFTIAYRNLSVEIINWEYLIKINNASLKFYLLDSNNRKVIYNINYNSYYDFKTKSFYNITFRIKEDKNKHISKKSYFNFKGRKINIKDLEKELLEFLQNVN